MRKRIVGSLLAVIVGLASVDCGCSDVGCAGGLTVFVDGTWSEGQYDVELDLDGASESCAIIVAADSTSTAMCTGTVFASLRANDRAEFSISSDAETVKMRIQKNGTEIFSRDFEPAYEEFSPNGAFCGPTCSSAQETFTL